MMIGIIVLLCVVIFLVFKKSKYGCDKKKKEYVNQCYESNEGIFKIIGEKHCFEIHKDNEWVFTVVDGQIVSISDKEKKRIYEVK